MSTSTEVVKLRLEVQTRKPLDRCLRESHPALPSCEVRPAQGGQMSDNEEAGSPAENRNLEGLSTTEEPAEEPAPSPGHDQSEDDLPAPASPTPVLVSVGTVSSWAFQPEPASPEEPEAGTSGETKVFAGSMEAINEEFCFLLCHSCKSESKCPKLLSCLHTICSKCMESHEPAGQCPICLDSYSEEANLRSMDNLFFESLQRRISVYQNIVQGGAEATCNRCRESADFWCFECEQLICTRCFEAHQWFVKHEARAVDELRKESAKDFLDGTRKSNNLFCPNPTHRTPSLTSIYCRGCAKPICCTCALLDSNHKDQYCAISSEIQQRQEELVKITGDLKTQENTFREAHNEIQASIDHLEQVKKETEDLIHSQVQIMVEQIQAKEKELLETVEGQYQQSHEEMAGKLRHLNGMLQRIQNGELLVEKIQHYASDQEVLEMHNFIREALEHLNKEKPMNVPNGVKMEEFEDCKAKLQALFARVTKDKVSEPENLEIEEKKEEPMEPTTINTDSDSDEKKLQKQGRFAENKAEPQPQHPVVQSRKRKSALVRKIISGKMIKKECGDMGRHKMNKIFRQPQASTSGASHAPRRAGPNPHASASASRPTAEANDARAQEPGFMVTSSLEDYLSSSSSPSSDENMDTFILSDQELEDQQNYGY